MQHEYAPPANQPAFACGNTFLLQGSLSTTTVLESWESVSTVRHTYNEALWAFVKRVKYDQGIFSKPACVEKARTPGTHIANTECSSLKSPPGATLTKRFRTPTTDASVEHRKLTCASQQQHDQTVRLTTPRSSSARQAEGKSLEGVQLLGNTRKDGTRREI